MNLGVLTEDPSTITGVIRILEHLQQYVPKDVSGKLVKSENIHGYTHLIENNININIDKIYIYFAAPVAERLRALFLNHSIISPLCLVRVRDPHWPHVRQAYLLAGMPVVFSRGSPIFAPPTDSTKIQVPKIHELYITSNIVNLIIPFH